jgi:hypothetical protein
MAGVYTSLDSSSVTPELFIPGPKPAPAFRVPLRELPAYRYLPGHGPHPFRHPAGHAYVGGQAPKAPFWDATLVPEQDPLWLWPMDLFDHRYFWEAHEAWEGLWHQLPRQSRRAQLLQGLIQVSAAVLKSHLGQVRAARSLMTAARPRVGKGGWTVDGERLLARTEHFMKGGPWPLI